MPLCGLRCCGATLIGNRVIGVRVTPISGCFVGRGPYVELDPGPGFTGEAAVSVGGGGGGGSGGGGSLLAT